MPKRRIIAFGPRAVCEALGARGAIPAPKPVVDDRIPVADRIIALEEREARLAALRHLNRIGRM